MIVQAYLASVRGHAHIIYKEKVDLEWMVVVVDFLSFGGVASTPQRQAWHGPLPLARARAASYHVPVRTTSTVFGAIYKTNMFSLYVICIAGARIQLIRLDDLNSRTAR